MLKHFKRWCNFEISFWFFKVTFKRWCNTFWIIFSLVWFIWHSCKRWCNINPLNMFKLVLTFRKKVQFRNFYLVHLHKMVQYKISLSWFILIYLNLSLSWSIPIYIYLDLSQSISILIYQNQSWSILIVVRDFGFFLPSGFLSVLTNIIFSNSDFLSGIAK